jgi:hypothetical protein
MPIHSEQTIEAKTGLSTATNIGLAPCAGIVVILISALITAEIAR